MIVVDCCEQRNICLLDMLTSRDIDAISLEKFARRDCKKDVELVLGVGTNLTDKQISLIGKGSKVFYFVGNKSIDKIPTKKICLMNMPSFVQANSYLTAEGALGYIITHTDFSLLDAHVCVTGWGYLAKECAKVLGKMSKNLTVMARSEKARKQAVEWGYKSVDISDDMREFDVIVNTIPAKIFSSPQLNRNVFIIELASKIYPFDYEELGRANVNYLIAKAVPSQLSSISAARVLMDAIISYKE